MWLFIGGIFTGIGISIVVAVVIIWLSLSRTMTSHHKEQ